MVYDWRILTGLESVLSEKRTGVVYDWRILKGLESVLSDLNRCLAQSDNAMLFGLKKIEEPGTE